MSHTELAEDFCKTSSPIDSYEYVYITDLRKLVYRKLSDIVADPRFGTDIQPQFIKFKVRGALFGASHIMNVKIDWPVGGFLEVGGTWRRVKILWHSFFGGPCPTCKGSNVWHGHAFLFVMKKGAGGLSSDGGTEDAEVPVDNEDGEKSDTEEVSEDDEDGTSENERFWAQFEVSETEPLL